MLLQVVVGQNNSRSPFNRFGFRTGINISHVNFAQGSPPPDIPIETSRRTGINIGFLILVPLNDRLFFQPEYLYSQMGGQEKKSGTVYKLNYFSMPVFLKYQLTEKFSLMAGPQFDLLINAKKIDSGSSSLITHDTEERSFAVTAGVEFKIIRSISLCARYVHGINHIDIGQEFKFQTLQLSTCVHF
jgi:hypothetical protein